MTIWTQLCDNKQRLKGSVHPTCSRDKESDHRDRSGVSKEISGRQQVEQSGARAGRALPEAHRFKSNWHRCVLELYTLITVLILFQKELI